MPSFLRGATFLSGVVLAAPLFGALAAADEIPPAVLEQLKELQERVAEQQKVIEEQQRRLSQVERLVIAPDPRLDRLWSDNGAGGPGSTRVNTAPGTQPAIYDQGSWVAEPRYAQLKGAEPLPVAPVPPVPPSEQEPTPEAPAPSAEEEPVPAPSPAVEPAGEEIVPVPPAPLAEPEQVPVPLAPPVEAPVVPAPPTGEVPVPAAPTPAEEGLEEERPEGVEKPVEELLLEAGAVLLPAGTLQVEPLVDYTHTSSDRINILGFTIFEAIVIGLIRVDEIERDIVRPTLNLRYGVADRIQLESTVPYVYRQDTEILGVGTTGQSEVTINNFALGDVELAGAYQLFTQREWVPGTVLRLRGRFPTGTSAFDIETTEVLVNERRRTVLKEAPTGSGFYGVAPGATFIWRTDPVAFFGGGSYTMNLPRTFEEFGDIDPGDTIEFFAGMNVALSDRVGINLSFVDQFTGRTTQNDEEQEGTDVNDARVILGASYGLAPNTSILVSTSIGLTDESPDFTFTVSVPMNFSLY